MSDWMFFASLAVAALVFTPWFGRVCDRVCPYTLVAQHDMLRGWQVWLERKDRR